MKIGVAGGGPAGFYFSLLARNQGHEVTVFERNPPGATYGWGVVFSEGTLSEFASTDQRLARGLEDALIRWSTIRIHRGGAETIAKGQPFAAISRRSLLGILADAASETGVEIRYSTSFEPGQEEEFGLVVAADGVNSAWRRNSPQAFGPEEWTHPTRYIWLGWDRRVPGFTFIFQPTQHGLFWVHAYPFQANLSTFIVETAEDSWRRAGLDDASEEESLSFCQAMFTDFLDGGTLRSNRAMWLRFVTLRNRNWVRKGEPPVVLVGDAAHTAHFSIGSGTKLAMEDAAVLAESLALHPGDLPVALATYEALRRPAVERFQEAALASADYFAHVSDLIDLPDATFAFNLLTRSGRVSHLDLQRQDPQLVLATGAIAPALAPIEIAHVVLPHRLLGGALGLEVTQPLAVRADGKRSADEPLGETYPYATDVVVLTHAGPRAGNRPGVDGLDRPPLVGDFETLAASPVAYTPRHARPREANDIDLEELASAFEHMAQAWRDRARVLLIDGSGGTLLGSFLSPLTNHRTDRHGGTIENRVRFPLAVMAAVRAVWNGPLGFRFSATDWHPHGVTEEDAVAVAIALRGGGVDFIEVAGGGTVAEYDAPFRPGYLIPLASRVRNRAKVPVLVGGGISTLDQANTIIAAGRADLIRMSPA